MKTRLQKTFHWLSYIILSGALLFLLGLFLVIQLANRYCSNIEEYLSKRTQVAVKIQRVSFGLNGFEPVIKISNLQLQTRDEPKQPLLSAQQLLVGIDFWGTLFTLKPKLDFLMVDGTKLHFQQNATGEIVWQGIKLLPTSFSAAESSVKTDHTFVRLARWLLTQGRVKLRNTEINITLATKQQVKLCGLTCELQRSLLQYHLQILGEIYLGKRLAKPLICHADLRFNGDIFTAFHKAKVNGEIEIENFNYEKKSASAVDFAALKPLLLPWMVSSGNLVLTLRNSIIPLPCFRQPLRINELRSTAKFKINHDLTEMEMQFSKVAYRDPWLNFTGQANFVFTAGKEPLADVVMNFQLGNACNAKRYFPATVIPTNALKWLDQAFINSKKLVGKTVLKGDLANFPFDNNDGTFTVTTTLNNVELNYDNDWPRITNICGEMVFDKRSMNIQATFGKILGERFEHVQAIIPNLDLPELYIDGKINTHSAKGLEFIQLSPLKNGIGRKLIPIILQGGMKLQLQFVLPLDEALNDQETKINGSVQLTDNQLVVKGLNFTVDQLNGKLLFNEHSFSSDPLRGSSFGEPISIKITPELYEQQAWTGIKLQSDLPLSNILTGDYRKLSSHLQGKLAYQLNILLHNTSNKFNFDFFTDLDGVNITLPEPFTKTMREKLPVRCSGKMLKDGEQLLVQLAYGERLEALGQLHLDPTTWALKLQSLLVQLGKLKSKTVVDSGYLLAGNLKQLDLAVWRQLSNMLPTTLQNNKFLVETNVRLQLLIERLIAYDNQFGPINIGGTLGIDKGNLSINAPEIAGSINFAKGKFDANFDHIKISKPFKLVNTNKLGTSKKAWWLTLMCNDFTYGDLAMHALNVDAQSVGEGGRINKLTTTIAGSQLTLSCDWNLNAMRVIRGRGSLVVPNLGESLRRWNIYSGLRGGEGVVNCVFKMPESIFSAGEKSIDKISGQLSFNLKEGRFVDLEGSMQSRLGFGKMLNFFSPESLSRRLSLNFDDLKDGYHFSNARGKISFSQGKVDIERIKTASSVADLELHGQLNLLQKSYDLDLGVIPNLTSTVPIAVAVASGPILGAASFVANKLFAKAINRAGEKHYRMQGNWKNSD